MVQIESTSYEIASKEGLVKFLEDLLDKAHYGGERICLESVTMNKETGKPEYEEIERWG